ncbi:hypothetical protein Tco_1262163 [Tanacetum coccineum]
MGLNDLINWYQSHGALDLGFKVLWSKNEGTDKVLEGTAQEYDSTAGANLSTAEVYESTAHLLFKISVITTWSLQRVRRIQELETYGVSREAIVLNVKSSTMHHLRDVVSLLLFLILITTASLISTA